MSRPFFVREVLQVGSVDCGPACLQSVLLTWGVEASYGAVREACQVERNGTSFNAIEDAAKSFGLDVEQGVLPITSIGTELFPFPALLATVSADSGMHVVIAWRKCGPFIQVMDPARGRNWVHWQQLQRQCVRFTTLVPAQEWREWANTTGFQQLLARGVARLTGDIAFANRTVSSAFATGDHLDICHVDAVTAFLQEVSSRTALKPRVAVSLLDRLCRDPATASAIPPEHWSNKPVLVSEGADIAVTGVPAIVIGACVCGMGQKIPSADTRTRHATVPSSPWALFWLGGPRGLLVICLLTVLTAVGMVVQPWLLRALVRRSSAAISVTSEPLLIGGITGFAVVLCFLEAFSNSVAMASGRYIDVWRRSILFETIPRLRDRFIRTYPIPDIARYLHSRHQLSALPVSLSRGVGSICRIVVICVALVMLDREFAVPLAFMAAATIVPSWICRGAVLRREVDVQKAARHVTAIGSAALAASAAIAGHSAMDAVRVRHGTALRGWRQAHHAASSLRRTLDFIQTVTGVVVLVWIVSIASSRNTDYSGTLLAAYLVVSIVAAGYELLGSTHQYVRLKRVIMAERILQGPSEHTMATDLGPHRNGVRAVRIVMRDVTLRYGHKTVVSRLNLEICPGTHVVVVGRSGAGKSSLLGMLLGWHRPVGGVAVDGRVLDPPLLAWLRQRTAWVDTTVHLWQTSIYENVIYGQPSLNHERLTRVLALTGLQNVMRRHSMSADVDINHCSRVSEGECELIRLGRAMMKEDVGLVVLDEPFRALGRHQRAEQWRNAREWWRGTTLLCVTHDLDIAMRCDRVVVMDDGRIVEDGKPDALAADPESRFFKLRQSREYVEDLFAGRNVRRIELRPPFVSV